MGLNIETDAAEVALRETKVPLARLIMRQRHWTHGRADEECETNYPRYTLGNNVHLARAREALILGLYEKSHSEHAIAAFLRCEESAVKRVVAEIRAKEAEKRRDARKRAGVGRPKKATKATKATKAPLDAGGES